MSINLFSRETFLKPDDNISLKGFNIYMSQCDNSAHFVYKNNKIK